MIVRLILTTILLIYGCQNDRGLTGSSENYEYVIPEQVNDGWVTASLTEVGMEIQPLEDLVAEIQDGMHGEVHSVVIIKNDKLVFEKYFPGHDFSYLGDNFHGAAISFNRSTLHNTHSATKSIVATLVGMAIENGFIGGLDDNLFMYYGPYDYLRNSQKDKITIGHLLTMTSGLEWNEWDVPPGDPEYDTYLFNISPDPIAYILSKPVVTEPGSSFYYNGGGVDLLGDLIGRASGIRLNTFSDQFLFGPMGVTNYNWQTLPSGLVVAHGDIYITPRDMAKYGYLLLNGGEWDGNQIISEHWINESTKSWVQLPQVSWADSYGYLTWRKTYHSANDSYDSFFAEGWGGQKIVVFPAMDMVVVFTGANYVTNPPCDEILEEFILPAINH